MKDRWFSVESIAPDTWVISEPLHREHTHCYLLTGRARALLIDTGMGICDLADIVGQLTALPVQVVATHVHWDHIGSHGSFSQIAVHPLERSWLSGSFPLPPEQVKQNLRDENCPFPASFSWQDFSLYTKGASAVFVDGDVFDLGERLVEVIHTPGHSPGHCCFYEKARGWLWSGDLIYQGKLDAFYPTTDPVEFYRSIRRVARLPITRIFPGHYSLELSSELPRQIEAAFDQLDRGGQLHHGSGTFDFGQFQIQI